MKIYSRCTITSILLLLSTSLAIAQFPQPFGLWQFDDNTLNNDISGRSAMAATNFTAAYADDSIATHSARGLAVPALSAANQNLTLPTSFDVNGGGAASRVNQWSVVMDVKLSSLPAFTALLQTEMTNADTADVHLSSTGALEFSGLTNAIIDPVPQVTVGKWTRLAITCGNNGAGGPLTVRGYIDGVMVFENTSQALDGRYSQQASMLLFADFQGRSTALSCNSVAYWSTTLTESDVDELGGPSAGGLTRFVVVNEDSSGPGSLTQAITDAAATSGPDSIGFSRYLNGETILLTAQYFVSGSTLKIDATALPDGITLDANLASRHFQTSSSGNLSLRNLTLIRGKVTGSERGGSIRNGGPTSLSRCVFIGNSTENGGGAVAHSASGALLTAEDCTFSDNFASVSGGGLFVQFGSANITRCAFTENSSSEGSAVAASNPAVVTLSNCTLVGNQAANQSMIDVGGGSSVSLQNCTITRNRGNSANSGLSVRSTATANVSGCIIAGNLGAGGVPGDIAPVGGTLNASGFNFIGSNDGATTQFPTGPLAGTSAAPLDPKLSPLGYFGGPLQTLHPLLGSPVIDAAGTTNPGGTDARGFSRFVDGDANATAQLDIGAVEAGPLFTVTATGDAAAAPGTLRTVLASAVAQPGARIAFNSGTFPTGTVTLSGTELSIPAASSVFIDASNLTGPVTISGNNLSRIFSIPASATLAMHSLRMINGLATVGRQEGGGVLNHGSATLMACTLSGNRAANGGTSAGGGGVFNAGVMMLASSTLSGNQAGNNTSGGANGGGISNDGTLTIASSTLSGNSAGNATVDGDDGGDGGGIFNDGILTLTSSTVAANAAGQGLGAAGFDGRGGGIRNRGEMILLNSIVAGNTGIEGPDVFNGGNVITASGVNILSQVANSDLTAGATVIVADPLLAPLSSRGGPTQTMALLPGSPARNAATGSTSRMDQRGFPLVGTADIGAYEAQIGPIADTSTSQSTPTSELPFTVGQIGTLSGASSNTTLVPNTNFTFGGSGTNRTVVVTPAQGQSGSALITITDNLTDETQTFTVTVNPIDTLVRNGSDSGDGSLRQALITAAAEPGPNIIGFHPDFTSSIITLSSEIVIDDSAGVTIDASDRPNGVTIDGGPGTNRLFRVTSGSSITMRRLKMINGNGVGGGSGNHGGAIFNEGTLTLRECTISNCSATSGNSAGAIWNDHPGVLTIERSTLSGNSAAAGGGAITHLSQNLLTLSYCTVVNNTAGFEAGAINAPFTRPVSLTHCTITGNAVTSAPSNGVGGVRGLPEGFVTVRDCIITGNTDANASGVPDITPGFISQGTNIIGTDAQLAALGNYGGPTQTRMLLPTSPAVDAATNSTATTDQRGYPVLGVADIGAYERQLGSIASVTIRQGSTPVPLSFPIGQVGTLIGTSSNEAAVPNGFVTFNGSGANHTVTVNPLSSGVGSTVMTITDFTNGETQNFNFTILSLRVSGGNDSGPGSLRQALANAAALPGPDTVTYPSGFGGQIHNLQSELVIADNDPVTIDASNLAGGLTLDADGNSRHFHVQSGKTLTLRGLTLTRGSASGNGGSILNEGTLNLDRCALIENDSTGDGGAIHSTGTLDAENSAFTQNQSGGLGGGISVSGGTADLLACTLSGNSSSNGGALFLDGDPEVALSHCTVSGNSSPAQFSTGGVVVISGDLLLEHCTVSENAGLGSGGGLFIDALASVEITSCLIAGNTDSGPAYDILNSGGILVARGNSLIGNNQSVATQFPTSPLVGTATAPVDARLAPLGNYGGPTQTRMPLPDSPAIDQGSPVNSAFTTDQRGFPRLLGVRPDIGAVEGPVIIVTTPVDELNAPGSPGNGVSLREAIRDVEADGIIAFDRAVFNSTTTNTITLTKGPLNPQRDCTLNGELNPGGIRIVQVPTITAQPQPQSVASNEAASFTITVTNDSGGLAYDWRKNGVSNGTTTESLNIASAQEADEGVYDAVLSEAGAPGTLTLSDVALGSFSATSQPASLVVDGSPVAVPRGPSSAMIALGSSHTLRVVAVGPSPLTYQWLLNGKNISKATQSQHVIPKAALNQAGAYTCVVKSGAATVTSTTAHLGVVDTTAKTFHLKAGGSFSASVNAAGDGITFAWLKNDSATAFDTKSFAIKPVAAEDAGLYTCTVTGTAGTFTGGAPTLLTVSNAAPQIIEPLNLPAATIGQAYFYQIPIASVVGAPATAFTVGGLPPGMTWDKLTGIISGRPTASTKPLGYPLTIKASNPSSSDSATATLKVNVVPANAVGIYAGPLERSPLNDNLGGRFDLTTTATGLCSGSITLGARAKLSFTNQLLLSAGQGDVILRANIPGITLADKTPLTAYVEVFATDQTACLTLLHPNGTTLLATAWRNTWSKTRPATAYAATYTARLDPANVGNSPRGYGFATLIVKPDGPLTLTGKLPDGSGLTQAGFVGPEGQITLFSLLHAKRGSLVGPMQLTPGTPVANNTVGGTLDWFKPGPLPKSTDIVYQAGFGPLAVTVEGSPYAAPAKGQRVMGLGTTPNPNAKLDFTLGGLAPEFAQLLHIINPSATGLTNKGTLTLPLTNTTKLTTLDAAKGMFKGSFVINGATSALNRPAPFEGLIVKIGATTQGYGFFLLPTATAKIATSPKLSGRVVLGEP